MRKIVLILLFGINTSFLFAQTVLTIEGTNTINSASGVWDGVNIPRGTPTALTYRNNSVTSANSTGYMLHAGDEDPGSTNNNLQGEVITGNKFTWIGTDPAAFTHGVFTGYNLNAIIEYNYLNDIDLGIIRKSNGMTNTSGGVAYNIINRSRTGIGLASCGIAVKGINNVNIYNNTFYSNENTSRNGGTWRGLIDVYANDSPAAYSTGTKIKNNIFYTKYQIYNIFIYEAGDLPGFESDYNVFYCETGAPMFDYLGTPKTFTEWQALGFDAHSVVVNPNFTNFTDFVPGTRLDYGTSLGTTWQAGLSVNAVWNVGSSPTTANQNGPWQVGARIYYSPTTPVTNINVTGAGGLSAITSSSGTLQLAAEVLPATASDKSVTWLIINGTGIANISSTGLVTAVDNGTVTARATANDGSGIYGLMVITITNQVVPVTGITVTGAGGATSINSENGTLQLSAAVFPDYATNTSVTWSVVNGTGQATISVSGLVTAVSDGTVTAKATANDGSGISGTLVITNSKYVTGITVTGAGGAITITADKGTLQLSAAILPANATIKTVTWSVSDGTGQAAISSTGVVTAVSNGTVTATATANDGSGVSGSLIITNSNQTIAVTSITVSGAGGSTIITSDNGTLQLNASVLPGNATNKTTTWSIANGTGQASISATGLVTAINNGTVTATATANDGSGVHGSLIITISNQIIPVSSITVTGAGGAAVITTDKGTLQLNAAVLPANASNKTVAWSITNGTGRALISSSGRVTAIDNGTVTARATANDGSGVSGSLIITNSNQTVPVSSIIVTGAEGATSIAIDNGSLQLIAIVLPLNAVNRTVTWSISNGTGEAIINSSGFVTAVSNGTVTARATANDGSNVFGTLTLTLSNQIVPVTGITVTGAGGLSTISTFHGTLQLSAAVLPVNASDKTVTWSIANGTGQATINSSGLVTSVSNGTVTARATANDGSGVSGTIIITITGQIIYANSLVITGAGGSTVINTDKGTLQLSAIILPSNTTDKSVTWSVFDGSERATINSSGLVTAVDNGRVTIMASTNDGSGVYNTVIITISGQAIPVTGIIVTGPGGSSVANMSALTFQLSTIVFPDNATDKSVTWSVDNITGQATINSSGLVSAVKNGEVTGKATANDGSGIYGTITINIYSVNGTTPGEFDPIKIIVAGYEMKILLNGNTARWNVGLYDLQGRLILSKLLESDIISFDVSMLPPGIYLVVVSKGESLKVSTVVIP